MADFPVTPADSDSSNFGTLPTPPYSTDLLSDLHAAALDDGVAGQLWPRVRADEDAVRYLDSLNAVTDLLGRRGHDLDATEPIPDWVRHRLETSILDQSHSTTTQFRTAKFRTTQLPTTPVADGTNWTGRRGLMIMLAAAAVVGIATAGISGLVSGGVIGGSNDHVAVTADGDTAGAIDTKLITESIGLPASGVFADPARLAACLTANGVAGDSRVLGMSEIMLRGRAATLIVVPGTNAPAITAIAVGDRCGDGIADTVSRVELG